MKNPLFSKSHELNGRKFKLPKLNWLLILCTLGLLLYGILFVRSACAIRVGPVHDIWLKTITQWTPVGILAHIILVAIPYKKWIEHAWILWIGAIILLILVLIPGIGTTNGMGARRWIFGFFQPSEAAKIALIPALTFILTESAITNEVKKFFATLLVAGIPAALILIEPDMGTSLPFLAAAYAMLFVSGCAKKLLLTCTILGVIFCTLFLGAILIPESGKLTPTQKEKFEAVTSHFIYDHWKARILTFVDPDRDPLGAGWNKRQSEIAVGSGGMTGKGYKNGTQNILGYLPASVSSSDFIFSVIAEESGFRGSLLLLLLFAGLLGSIIVAGIRARGPEKDDALKGRLICTGVAAILFTHIFINIGMTIGVMPITGIPLPLVSYGGTFTISTLALLGLAHNVSIRRRVASN